MFLGRLPARLRQRAGFVLSFFFKNGIYVDIVSIFKEKNKGKRDSQECTFIFDSLLYHINKDKIEINFI